MPARFGLRYACSISFVSYAVSNVVTTWHVGSSWSESRLNNCNYLSFLCLFREEENSEVIYLGRIGVLKFYLYSAS